MLSKKRKIDSENRKFMNEWTELYCFILPERVGAIPVCLICNSTVAIIKSGNLKRHYETTHKDFHTKFPPGSEVRKNKLHACMLSYKNSTTTLIRCMSEQEKSTEAALRVCWVLNKHQKPFSDSEIVKECMLEVATALFQENKKIVTSIQDIPLSARCNTRRTEMLAAENKKSLFELLHKSPCYCIALDESCDLVDSEQMSIFVRFFDIENKVFREELLAILTFEGKTRGEDLFKSFDDFMKKSDLSYDKIVSISTDGAPAMMGKEKGLLKRMRDNNSGILTYQCIIHQTSLCSKLSATLKDVMDGLIKLINFIRSRSSLQHRQFKEFLCQCDSAYSDILQHNHVRWLSKGRVVERFWNIKEEVKTFLKNVDTEEAKKHSDFLENNRNIVAMAFLNDILKYLNTLNVELQGEGKLICDLIQSVSAFRRKLNIFKGDIEQKKFIHFPTIFECKNHSEIINIETFLSFLSDLMKEFDARFKDFSEIGKLSQFLKTPYDVLPDGEWTDVAEKLFNLSKSKLQMEIIDLQEDVSLKQYRSASTEEFWAKDAIDKYSNCKQLAINLATMFGSTYICEASFSKINFLKNKYRTKLTDSHLEDTLRISCSPRVPDFKKLAKEKKCNFSH
jgi:hypothetical protein